MPRPKSSASETSDMDADGAAEHEAEYQRLERQYRQMETDRKSYSQETQDLIKKQRAEIEKLEREQEEMLKDLRLIESRSNQTKDDKHCETLGELGKQKRDVEDEIKEEKRKQQELDAQIREMEQKVRNQQGGGSAGGSGSRSAGGKGETPAQKNRKLENQLQLANNKFGKALEANKQLRVEIDNLRVERNRFDQLYKKLDKERQDLQRETGEVIDQSTQAYDQRVEAQEKMVMLNEKAEKDIQQHNAEMKELVRVIDHDRKLRDFMNTKGKERSEDSQMVDWRTEKELREAEKKKASQTDTADSYEKAFMRIREITGEDDIDLLVNRFIEVEDENFALFNYVNEQNDQVELLQEQIQQIKNDIRNFNSQGVELEAQRQQMLKQLELKQLQMSKQADAFDERRKELNKILDQLKAAIMSLFTKIGCEATAIDNLLGVHEGVTEQNMLQYLGIIEERTNQLLLAQAYITKQKDYDDFLRRQPSLLGEGPQAQTQPPSVQPPVVGDEYDSDGSQPSDDDRPLTRGELMNKAMRSVRKREQTLKKQGTMYEAPDMRGEKKGKDKQAKKTTIKA